MKPQPKMLFVFLTLMLAINLACAGVAAAPTATLQLRQQRSRQKPRHPLKSLHLQQCQQKQLLNWTRKFTTIPPEPFRTIPPWAGISKKQIMMPI